jgi:hypothetical protein
MIFLIPLLTRAVLVGSGVIVAKSVYDRTQIEREKLELEKAKAKAPAVTPHPPAPDNKP